MPINLGAGDEHLSAAMSANPYADSETVMIAAPSQTTYDAPSNLASQLIGAQPSWEQTSCMMHVKVPLGGQTTVSSDALQTSLCASAGIDNDMAASVVVHPTAFQIVGSQSQNPTGEAVGINISNTAKSAMHIDAGSKVQAFSGILSSQFHPSGTTEVPLAGVKVGEEARATRAAIAAKWVGIRQEDLMTGVQQMQGAKVDGKMPQPQFAIPIATICAETGEAKQQPLAWAVERNQQVMADQVTMGQMPMGPDNTPTDCFFVGAKAMEAIVGATTENVFGAQKVGDLVISAHALGDNDGGHVTLGLRCNADVLSFVRDLE